MSAHDERISSYLDDALPPSERSAFEAELRDNDELQQQVAELSQLQQDVALLPRYKAKVDFAQRVVAAAIAAKADKDAQITPARTESKPVSKKTSRRALIGGLAVAASVAIILGSLPFLKRPNAVDNPSNNVAVKQPENKALAPVFAALPGEGEALVLRIKSPKALGAGNVLREAFAEQGIQKRRSNDQNGTIVGNAYRAQLGSDGERIRPEGAFFVEMSPQELELALLRLAEPGQNVKFVPESKLAVAKPGSSAIGPDVKVGGENTGGNPNVAVAQEPPTAPAADFVQELSTSLFRIPKTEPEAPAVTPTAAPAPKGKVRVLILIEAVD